MSGVINFAPVWHTRQGPRNWVFAKLTNLAMLDCPNKNAVKSYHDPGNTTASTVSQMKSAMVVAFSSLHVNESLSVHLSLCLSVHLTFCLSACLVRSSARPSVRPSVRSSDCLSFCLSACLVHPSVRPSVRPSDCLSFCLSASLSISLSVCLSAYPFVRLCLCGMFDSTGRHNKYLKNGSQVIDYQLERSACTGLADIFGSDQDITFFWNWRFYDSVWWR